MVTGLGAGLGGEGGEPAVLVRIVLGLDPGVGGRDLEVENDQRGDEADDGKDVTQTGLGCFLFFLIQGEGARALGRKCCAER